MFALFAITTIYGQPTDNQIIHVIFSSASERAYITDPVMDQQLDLILKRGIKDPGSLNNQPWKFTVIKEEAIMKNVINDAVPGNVLIVVSGLMADDGSTPDFDLFYSGTDYRSVVGNKD